MGIKNLKEMIYNLTLEQQQLLYEKISKPETENAEQYDIAIIGLSGKYPQSENHYDFWDKIRKETNFIQEVPGERWDHSQYYDPEIKKSFVPNKTRCKFGAFLNKYNSFDSSFFDLDPDILFAVDPQERVALETTWSCIEDAGYVPEKLGTEVGVFTGITGSEYQKLIPISTHSYILNNRITYFFNFQGPAVTTDAGCCSSLASIHLACQSLMKKECKVAIIIGTNMILHPDHYSGSSSMLSPSTKPCSNPFGVDDGWIPAEGVVSILLKPLNQAVMDSDHIYGIIKSSHICQEGKTSWFGASSPKQQAKMMVDNFKKSGISPETISCVEAAANGSSLGDAIELEGLSTAFSHFTDKKQFCSIGTVKSNAGHAEGVSTLVQLTKVLLQFKSKTLFPIINLEKTNLNIDIENTPFYFQKSAQEWKPPVVEINGKTFEMPRRATISSFGTGGSSGHLILEEYAASAAEKQTLNSYYIPLSSKTPHQLKQTVRSYVEFFDEYAAIDVKMEQQYTLLNIMFTLCTGRVDFKERVVFIAGSVEALIKQFHKFLDEEHDNNIILKNQQAAINEAGDIARLWVAGESVSWEAFFDSLSCRRVSLPTYCFDRQAYPIPKPNCPIPSPACTTVIKQNRAEAVTGHNNSFEIDINVVEFFTKIFSGAFNIAESQIDISIPMDKYGFNSTMVICVADELRKYFSVVPKTLFFECQTIKDVINYFVKNNPDEVVRISSREEGTGNVRAVDEDSIEELTKAILSETMTAEMLLKKL